MKYKFITLEQAKGAYASITDSAFARTAVITQAKLSHLLSFEFVDADVTDPVDPPKELNGYQAHLISQFVLLDLDDSFLMISQRVSSSTGTSVDPGDASRDTTVTTADVFPGEVRRESEAGHSIEVITPSQLKDAMMEKYGGPDPTFPNYPKKLISEICVAFGLRGTFGGY